jgi:hypothetical protein
LYAPIGEEENGMVLTALSALARLGVDPWDEAARLSELPRETAAKRLTSIISALPQGQWAEASAEDIAARLGALLPGKRAPAAQRAIPYARPLPPSAVVMIVFLFFVNALAFFVVRDHAPQPIADPSISASSTAVPPQTPLP